MSREAVLLIKWRVGSCKLPFAVNRGGRTSVYQVVGAGTCREAALTTLIERPVYGYLQARSHGCTSAKDQSHLHGIMPAQVSRVMASTFPIRRCHNAVHGAPVADGSKRERGLILRDALRLI